MFSLDLFNITPVTAATGEKKEREKKNTRIKGGAPVIVGNKSGENFTRVPARLNRRTRDEEREASMTREKKDFEAGGGEERETLYGNEREITTAVARGGPGPCCVCARIYIIAGKSRNFFIIPGGTNTAGAGCL